MNTLLWIALLLLIIWIVAAVTEFVVGALLWVILVVAIVAFVVWLIGRVV